MKITDRLLGMKCYIIHLERAIQRAEHVRNLSKTLSFPVEIVSAIDAKASNFDISPSYKRGLLKPTYPFTLRPPEVALFLSYRKCWQRIVDEELDAGLIFEDDVSVTNPHFRNALELALANLEQGDVVRFPVRPKEKLRNIVSSNENCQLFLPAPVGLGTQAQLVSKRAAERLLEQTHFFDRPIDTYLQLFWQQNIRVLSVWPSGVSENSKSLGGSLISSKQSLLMKLKHEILRPIYRIKVVYLSRKYSKK